MAKMIAIGPLRSFLHLRDRLKDGFHNVLFAPTYEHALPVLKLAGYDAVLVSDEFPPAEVRYISERSHIFNPQAKVIALRGENMSQFPDAMVQAERPANVVAAVDAVLKVA
jgi:hypothetical protein